MSKETKTWLEEISKVIDSKDSEGFSNFISKNGSFRYGNQPAVTGRENIKNYVAEFFNMIDSSDHSILNCWKHDDAVIWQGQVKFKRLDGKVLPPVEFTNILYMDGDMIKDYLIYIDNSPLFAE